jgi:hypothetical protein
LADRGELAAHTGIGLTLPPVFVEGCRRAMRALVGPSVGIAPHSLRRVVAQRGQHRGAT